MKDTIRLALAATIIAAAAFGPSTANAQDKPQPATEEAQPVAYTGTGTLSKDGDKIQFTDEAGKIYLVTKNNTDTVTPFIGKKVKITGKSKTKMLANGKPLHMVVYVNRIAPVESPAGEPDKK